MGHSKKHGVPAPLCIMNDIGVGSLINYASSNF